MSHNEIVLATAHRLQQAGTPYALVSVTKALAPASARPGDKAVVTADGQLHGWVGGGCAQPAVIRTVRQALIDGRARMIRITPSADGAERAVGESLDESLDELLNDVLEFGMACHSGGTLELFVDPVLPRAQLVVIGSSPVALSLTQLAPRVGFNVSLVAHEVDAAAYPDAQQVIAVDDAAAVLPRIAAGAWVVVATQGRRDVQALRLALALQARQISFVASARKAQVLKASLTTAGADAAAVAAIIAPAGLPVAATTPEEIALSVLAAVVAHRRGAGVGLVSAAGAMMATAAAPATSIDPAPLAGLAAAESTSGRCCGGPAALSPSTLSQVPDVLALPAVKSSCCGS
jgi:xanthine dehydrogenase accessory factor